LIEAGCSIDFALSTDEAVRRLHSYQYSLVVSDMGRGSNRTAGIDLLQIMRRELFDYPTFVFCSNRAVNDHAEKAKDFGALLCTADDVELLDAILQVVEYTAFSAVGEIVTDGVATQGTGLGESSAKEDATISKNGIGDEVDDPRHDEPLIDIDLSSITLTEESLRIAHAAMTTVQDFINEVHYAIRSEVPSGTYGRKWLLQDRDTRRVLASRKRRGYAPKDDLRLLSDAGVYPGTRWEVLKLDLK
jgi:hypothetical protein